MPCIHCILRHDRAHCSNCSAPLGPALWRSHDVRACGAACRGAIDQLCAEMGWDARVWAVHLRPHEPTV